jgi:hypothetical protein
MWSVVLIGVLIVLVGTVWMLRAPRGRKTEPSYVYVNQDGSVREVSPGERVYLSTKFDTFDGGRPYIKARYDSRDGWGSLSGFMERHYVPSQMVIEPVNPDYDALEKQLKFDFLGASRAAGDVIVTNPDGSVSCTANPAISKEERFELSRRYQLGEQARREALAKIGKDKN